MVAMPKALVERFCRHFKAEFEIKVDDQLRGGRTGADVRAELESKIMAGIILNYPLNWA